MRKRLFEADTEITRALKAAEAELGTLKCRANDFADFIKVLTQALAKL